VHKLERAADDAIIVLLSCLRTSGSCFIPGQYVDILLRTARAGAFSMANPPHDDEFLQLHVPACPARALPNTFRGHEERDILRLEGLRHLFPAGGIGQADRFPRFRNRVAPIKAVIEAAFKKGISRPMSLYWGGAARRICT